jgi:O-methyltransferase
MTGVPGTQAPFAPACAGGVSAGIEGLARDGAGTESTTGHGSRPGDYPAPVRSRVQTIRSDVERLGRRVVDALGYEIHRKGSEHVDFDAELLKLCERVRPFTLTSEERIAALANATEYVVRRGIRGDFVECGVWHGGSAMAMALTLRRLRAATRRVWLYDTFTVVPPPGPEDIDVRGRRFQEEWASHDEAGVKMEVKSTQQVRDAVLSTGYDPGLVTLVEGLVENTIPAQVPERIALLRLDTDWYQSTRHELEHLYPRLEPGGVLIVDDYGEFLGARQAVEEYFSDDPILLNRIDYTGRIAVKL